MWNQAEEVLSDGLEVGTSKKKMPGRATLFRCRRYRVLSSGREETVVLPTNGVRRQNGFKNVGGWRKEPLAKKNRTRLFVCGKNSFEKHSLNVYDVPLGVGSSPMKLYSSPNADTCSDNADNR